MPVGVVLPVVVGFDGVFEPVVGDELDRRISWGANWTATTGVADSCDALGDAFAVVPDDITFGSKSNVNPANVEKSQNRSR